MVMRGNQVAKFVVMGAIIAIMAIIPHGFVTECKESNDMSFAENLEGLQEYMDGANIGVITGTIHEDTASEFFKNSPQKQFNNTSDMISALRSGKIKGFINNWYAGKQVADENDDLYASGYKLTTTDCAFAVKKGNTKLKKEIDETLENMKQDGRYQEIHDKWFNSDESTWTMPSADDLTGENGVIKIATLGNSTPFSIIFNGEPAGFELELLYNVALDHGYSIQYDTMNFSSILAAVVTGKDDIGSATLMITPERSEQILFSEPYIQNGHCLVIKKDSENEVGFAESIKSSFRKNFIDEERWKLIVSGVGVTLTISVLSGFFGSLLGFGVCFMRISRKKVISGIARGYIKILEGTPIVVFIMILYYVVFGESSISALWVAVIGFSLYFAATCAEIFRSGIEAVDSGQAEAAYAMGTSKFMTFHKIISPQAASNYLPVYKNSFVALVKSTSIVGYIAIEDLTKVSDMIRSRTFDAFFPLITTAIIYFVLANILVMLLNQISKILMRRSAR